MGAINDLFSQDNIYFSKIEEILKILIKQNKNKSQNITTLHEIGLLKEYSYIKLDKYSNELINFSKNNKSMKEIETSSKLRENFIKWTKFLFDINEEDLSEEKFNKKIELLKKISLNKTFFHKNIKKYIFKNKSFNKLIYYGIPNNFRDFIWDIVISEKYNNHNYYNYEEEQKKYNLILKKIKINSQIEKDLERTFFNEFERTPKNIKSLRNVLNCINRYTNNGYCQGMNYIVRFLLKITNFDEVQTFYFFKNILYDIKGYFEDGFPLLKKNLAKFNKYFKFLYLKLYNHFKKNEIYDEILVGKWFQTLFTLTLPFSELSNIWDILLIEGFDFIIFISLAIINSVEEELLKLNDSSDILAYLENLLNPNETTITNKKQFQEEKYYIIPLKEVITKAYKIEKEILKNDKSLLNTTLNKSYLLLNKEKEIHTEYESIYTKESDNSVTLNSSICSSNYGRFNSIKSSDLAITQKINNYKIKYNLGDAKFGLNSYNNNFIKKAQTFSVSKDLMSLNPQKNNIYINRTINMNTNGNDLSYLRNSTNIYYPLQTTHYIFYPNNFNSIIINNRPQYTNYLISYV